MLIKEVGVMVAVEELLKRGFERDVEKGVKKDVEKGIEEKDVDIYNWWIIYLCLSLF